MDDIQWNMENQKVTAMACIDLTVAFDTVDHAILADILRVRYVISDKALESS